jgi:uncharacterized protein (TIGR02466 family)
MSNPMPDAIDISSSMSSGYGNVQPWFPKLIYFKDNLHEDKLTSWADSIRNELTTITNPYTPELFVKSNHGNSNMIDNDDFKPLWDTILDHTQWFLGSMGYLNLKLQLTDAWANISYKDDYLFPHRHSGSLISGAFYLKSAPSDTIVFMDDDSMLIRPNHPTDLTWDKITYECLPGRLLLFKSDTLHGVTRQKSEEEKIVISFNIIGGY